MEAQKVHLVKSLDLFTRRQAADAIQLLGKALPCSVVSCDGKFVVVKFELGNIPFTLPQVRMPIASSQYDRIPFQAGDVGLAVPADAYLGGVDGQGGGTADLTLQANLAALAFLPLEAAVYRAYADATKRILYGQTGVQIDDGQVVRVKLVGGNYELGVNDYAVVVTSTGAVISMLPDPEPGRKYMLKAAQGVSATLTGNGNAIDDQGTYALGAYAGIIVFYDSQQWRVVP